MNPGLSIVGTSDVRSRTVDSIPIAVLSPLTIASILPSISSATSSNVVGLGLPERLALGAAIGTPAASIISAASRRDGHLTATVSSPPVVTSGTPEFLRSTKVIGPGQSLLIRDFCSSVTPEATPLSISMFATWTIIGLSLGLPFASYICFVAVASRAFAPSPYTVSVGKATSPPERRIAPASEIPSVSGRIILVFIGCLSRFRNLSFSPPDPR